MNYSQVLNQEKEFIDQLCQEKSYDENIRHLLYVIIPAFIMKYGIAKEKLILNTFQTVSIERTNEKEKYIKAYYSSVPQEVNGEYKTRKHIVIQNYKEIQLVDLLDNLVHEFNHALNSYKNEIRTTKNYIYLRTGLTCRIFQKSNLQFVKKQNSYILEEIINTHQTSDIINIIKGIKSENRDIQNTIYAINSETESTYSSNSYYLQSYICKEILNNRTFIATLENLRLTGEVYDIEKWFDNITGEEKSYQILNQSLEEVYTLEEKYAEQKLWKSFTLRKIRFVSQRILRIVELFNNNVNFR
ncbi:MAG: hypothetical protein IJI60_04320 [Bacilli bacterium]|nr:hypothetical protein [Bacilli bacterium]